MASEIRVDKINSLSGVGTVTLSPTGVDIAGITTVSTLKVGTGVTASEDGDIFFTGIATATTFSGSGASLTALPAAQVTGTLPAISGANLTALNGSNIASGTVADARISTLTASKLSGALPAISALNLTNVPAANVVGVHTSLNITGATVVGSAVTISESGIEASGIGITCANINGTQIGGRRNIIINGAMQVTQRGTSSTTSGYSTIDRWSNSYAHDATMTFTQHALTSSDSGPYEEGFRYSNHVTNGDTTAATVQYYVSQQPIEAQNISMSGWNYKSSTGYITLSFWVKSSVGQTYQASLMTTDGTIYNYPFSFTLSADTWTKVIKTIPGNSNLQIDNDTGEGVRVNISPYMGTNYTSSGVNYDTWASWGSGTRFKDFTSTWWTTNSATFEFTGVQLEVGSQATAFEHQGYGDELQLCKRYYQQINQESSSTSILQGFGNGSGRLRAVLYLPVEMRANPTVALDVSGGNPSFYSYAGSPPSYSSLSGVESTKKTITVDINTSTVTAGDPIDWRGSSAFITIAAEL